MTKGGFLIKKIIIIIIIMMCDWFPLPPLVCISYVYKK